MSKFSGKIIGFLGLPKKDQQKSINGSAYEMNKHSSSVLNLFDAMEKERKLFPKSSSLIGPTVVNELANRMLDILVITVKTKWDQSHFDAFTENLRQGQLPEAYILNFITHRSADIMGSTELYPGVFTGDGESAVCLFEHAINRSIALKIYNEAWAQVNLRGPVYDKVKA